MVYGVRVFFITNAGNSLMTVPNKMVDGSLSPTKIFDDDFVRRNPLQRPVKRHNWNAGLRELTQAFTRERRHNDKTGNFLANHHRDLVLLELLIALRRDNQCHIATRRRKVLDRRRTLPEEQSTEITNDQPAHPRTLPFN